MTEKLINNSPEQIKLRKSQNTLIIVGAGMILFDIWSAVKALIVLLIGRADTIASVRENMTDDSLQLSDGAILAVTIIIFMLAVLIELGIRVYIGLSAIAEARGKRSGKLYLVLTVFFILFSFVTIAASIVALVTGAVKEGTSQEDVSMASIVIEVTSLIMMIQMIISAVRVKKYNKAAAQKGGHNAA